MKNTVKKHTHFKFILNCAEKYVLNSCVIYTIPNEQLFEKFKRYTRSVYGIMITKKLGGAVQRNFIKRRLRAALHGNDFTGNSLILIARKNCETMNFPKIKKEIKESIKKTKKIINQTITETICQK